MASSMLLRLQNLWPLSILKSDDLKVSNQLVRRLSIPDQTKQFVLALREPDSDVVVYFLAAQNLSEQSAIDAEHLIKEVKPKAVVAQVVPTALDEIQIEGKNLTDDLVNSVPTSSLEVLKRCLTDKINKEQYERLAGSRVLQEIFGVGFYGHFFSAKRTAEEVNSCFLLLEAPYESGCSAQSPTTTTAGDQSSGLNLQPNCLIPGKVASLASSSRRLCLTDTQLQAMKLLLPSLDSFFQNTKACESKQVVDDNYEAPSPFAESVYPLLVDLYHIFNDLPAIKTAMASAQDMLTKIMKGEPVDTRLLSEAYNFRIAIEGLRVALNDAAHCPVNKLENGNKVDFSELSSDEQCHALFAQALRSQAQKFGGPIVAIVDARRLAGLRKHWKTSIPPQIAALSDQIFIQHSSDDLREETEETVESDQEASKKKLLADKPVVAVSAGATAVIGATSLSKALPASTLVKVTTYQVPAVLKLGLASIKRQAYVSLSHILGPSKLLVPGFASGGAKTTSALKLTASAEKIRAVTHSMIASAERTSLLAIRTSFYEIMRKRRVGSIRFAPWGTFGCSVAICSGLLSYGDGIECAAESVPSVPAIASLGRGLQSLQQASQEVRRTSKIKEALESLVRNMNKK